MELALGLDCGTQSLKGLVLEEGGIVYYEDAITYDRDLPHYGTNGGASRWYIKETNCDAKETVFRRQEGDAESSQVYTTPSMMLIEALDTLLRRLVSRLAIENPTILANIKVIGTSGQQHGSVWWQRTCQDAFRYYLGSSLEGRVSSSIATDFPFSIPHGPIWMDMSTSAECKLLETMAPSLLTRSCSTETKLDDIAPSSQDGRTLLASECGNIPFHRFTLNQMTRLLRLYPDLIQNTLRVSLVSSFIPSLLAGTFAPIDASDAGGMNALCLFPTFPTSTTPSSVCSENGSNPTPSWSNALLTVPAHQLVCLYRNNGLCLFCARCLACLPPSTSSSHPLSSPTLYLCQPCKVQASKGVGWSLESSAASYVERIRTLLGPITTVPCIVGPLSKAIIHRCSTSLSHSPDQADGLATPLLSFPSDCMVASGSGDNPCASVGLGLFNEGDLGISLGTSDTLFGVVSRHRGMEIARKAQPVVCLPHPIDPSLMLVMIVFKNGAIARDRVRKALHTAPLCSACPLRENGEHQDKEVSWSDFDKYLTCPCNNVPTHKPSTTETDHDSFSRWRVVVHWDLGEITPTVVHGATLGYDIQHQRDHSSSSTTMTPICPKCSVTPFDVNVITACERARFVIQWQALTMLHHSQLLGLGITSNESSTSILSHHHRPRQVYVTGGSASKHLLQTWADVFNAKIITHAYETNPNDNRDTHTPFTNMAALGAAKLAFVALKNDKQRRLDTATTSTPTETMSTSAPTLERVERSKARRIIERVMCQPNEAQVKAFANVSLCMEHVIKHAMDKCTKTIT